MFFPFTHRQVGLGAAAAIRAVTPAIAAGLSYRNLKWLSSRSSEIYAADESIRKNNHDHGATGTTTRRGGFPGRFDPPTARAVPGRDAYLMPRRNYKRSRSGYGYGRRRNGYRKKRRTRRQRRRPGGLMYLTSGPIGERNMGGKFTSFTQSSLLSGTFNTSNIDPDTPIDCLSVVDQGFGAQQRMGRNMLIKNISINFQLKSISKEEQIAPETRQAQVRIILFVDHNTNGAQAGGALLMEAGGITSQYNLENVGRFTVLEDKTVTIVQTILIGQGANNFSASSTNKLFHMGFNFSPYLKIRYKTDNTSGQISGVTDNSIHLIAVHNSNGFLLTLDYDARIRFLDGAA